MAAQVPGSACVQPWPSQTPDMQLVLSTHGWPSASSAVLTGSVLAGGVVSVGVAAGSPVGDGFDGDGGGVPVVPEHAATVTTITRFSNSRRRMPASYTLRDG